MRDVVVRQVKVNQLSPLFLSVTLSYLNVGDMLTP